MSGPKYLRLSRDVLADQADQILDVWYRFVGSQPHLLHYLTSQSDGRPIQRYLEAVRDAIRAVDFRHGRRTAKKTISKRFAICFCPVDRRQPYSGRKHSNGS